MLYTKRIEISNIIHYYYYYYYYYYLPIKQPNEFQYHNARQDLLYMPHLLFWVDYL